MAKIRIALADDHTLLRKAMAAMLNAYKDFEVVVDAENGKELLQKLRSIKPFVDVCLLDMNMPEMNGYDTLLALKGQYPTVRVVIVTQLDNEKLVFKMLKAGALGFMQKSCEPKELRKCIMEVYENRAFYNGLVKKSIGEQFNAEPDEKKKQLSPKEEEMLKWCCYDLEYKQIAEKMNVTDSAVVFYRKELFFKLGVNSKTALALYALKFGLVSIEELGIG